MGVTNVDSLYASGPVYSQGAPVIPFTTGTVRFVSSTHANASDNHAGTEVSSPLATVDAAIGKCTASVGDVIVLMPGHAETVTATSIALDVAGVTIVGLGQGLNRPTFTYGAAAATITVSAANCAWKGCHFIGNFDDVAAAFTIGAAKDFRLETNTFRDNSSALHFLSIVVTGATNNAADGLTVIGNTWQGLAVAPAAFISVLGNLSFLNVRDNFTNMASTDDEGSFLTLSSKVLLAAEIIGNRHVVVGATGATVGIFLTGSATTCTGIVADNKVASLDTTTELIATAGTGLKVLQQLLHGHGGRQRQAVAGGRRSVVTHRAGWGITPHPAPLQKVPDSWCVITATRPSARTPKANSPTRSIARSPPIPAPSRIRATTKRSSRSAPVRRPTSCCNGATRPMMPTSAARS